MKKLYTFVALAILGAACSSGHPTGPSASPPPQTQAAVADAEPTVEAPTPAPGPTPQGLAWRVVLDGGPVGIQCPGGVTQINPRNTGYMNYVVDIERGHDRAFDIRAHIHYADGPPRCDENVISRPHPVHLDGKVYYAAGETGRFRGVVDPADIPCGGYAQVDIHAIDSETREEIPHALLYGGIIFAPPAPNCDPPPPVAAPVSPVAPPTPTPPAAPPVPPVAPPQPPVVPPLPPAVMPPVPLPPTPPPSNTCELNAFSIINDITISGDLARLELKLRDGYENVEVFFAAYGSDQKFPSINGRLEPQFPQFKVSEQRFTIRAGAIQTISIPVPRHTVAWQVDAICVSGQDMLLSRQTLTPPILEAALGNNR